MSIEEATKIYDLMQSSQRIVIVQADNPDGDSMGSALALEQILHNLGKEPSLYCAVHVPQYLRYMSGWDRVESTLPNHFDASIIVDTATMSLLEKAVESGDFNKLSKKPIVVLDHHATVEDEIPETYATIIDTSASSTGEVIFSFTQRVGIELDEIAGEHIMTAILGDTQGLSNELTQVSTYIAMSKLVEIGVNRPALEEKRRLSNKMPVPIYRYKAELISRTHFLADGTLAIVTIPQSEINEYSPLYNPGPLIQPDILQVEGVLMAIVVKSYDDGKMTGALRANTGAPIAGKLALVFGGGGHDYAAGFKTSKYSSVETIVPEIVKNYTTLLAEHNSKE